MQSYSHRLGMITTDQFQAALDRFALGSFVCAESITGGLFGQNVFITSTTGEHVLRGHPHASWQFPAERYFARRLHEQGRIPAPWPYRIDPTDEIFGWSYVLMPRMPGVQLSDSEVVRQLERGDRLNIAQALGDNLARMQRLSWPVAGRYDLDADAIVPFPGGFTDWVLATISDLIALARQHNGRTTPADAEWVWAIIESGAVAMTTSVTPCFVMNDYKEANVTVERDGAGWRVSGVFDLMEGCVADGEMDLCRPVIAYLDEDAELARAFLAAYLAQRPPRPGIRRRLPVYLLRERLFVWEYFQRSGHTPLWAPDLTLREWVEPYLAALMNLLTSCAIDSG